MKEGRERKRKDDKEEKQKEKSPMPDRMKLKNPGMSRQHLLLYSQFNVDLNVDC